MPKGTESERQMTLVEAFDDAEAAHVGKWNDVSLALSRIGTKCDLHLSRFVRMVFDMTHGGTSGALTKSYKALSERPAWLCCSQSKTRRTVETSVRMGFVNATSRRAWGGSQQENSYTINWSGVWSLLAGAGVHREHTPVPREHGPAQGEQGYVPREHHNKEEKLSRSFIEENSGTGTGAGPKPRKVSQSQSPSLSERLCEGSPILSAARERRIAPMPADILLHGCFAPIEERHLRAPLGLAVWHARQLSTKEPVVGDTEADLLLVLATALHAASLRKEDVRRNRVAAFISMLTRRAFTSALPFVPQARMLLDNAEQEHGTRWIEHVTWPGPPKAIAARPTAVSGLAPSESELAEARSVLGDARRVLEAAR